MESLRICFSYERVMLAGEICKNFHAWKNLSFCSFGDLYLWNMYKYNLECVIWYNFLAGKGIYMLLACCTDEKR